VFYPPAQIFCPSAAYSKIIEIIIIVVVAIILLVFIFLSFFFFNYRVSWHSPGYSEISL
jgi:heme/copper-type cytochrome/quinol oxidase subunit 2